MQLSLMEQEAVKLQEQMQLIDQQVLDMETLKQSIGEIEKGKGKEIMANLGKNVFIKTYLRQSLTLIYILSPPVPQDFASMKLPAANRRDHSERATQAGGKQIKGFSAKKHETL